ncbi:hypothetical protein O6H91_10G065900 [Diphasiastrum complanatum]|uniref:Uncharacterized protein n=1 Tax=Diphasiastrum complanatum TaxID=34168 RepID=A0ACC2CHZ5_DIPCM|nr:hypothetical protein O6H91_10G065900 [Diphasiastrum complanatum]
MEAPRREDCDSIVCIGVAGMVKRVQRMTSNFVGDLRSIKLGRSKVRSIVGSKDSRIVDDAPHSRARARSSTNFEGKQAHIDPKSSKGTTSPSPIGRIKNCIKSECSLQLSAFPGSKPSLQSFVGSACSSQAQKAGNSHRFSCHEQAPPSSSRCSNPSSHPSTVIRVDSRSGWVEGPAEEAGTVINLSDRPSLCMSVQGSEVAIGSSDHALYIVDASKGEFSRALYGGSFGHANWVTCVDHLEDGRIISGGMDSKLCLWERSGVRCRDLKGHSASISAVRGGFGGSRAVSSSYDTTLMIWDVSASVGKPVGRLEGHKAAVMGFTMSSRQQSLVSGCRNGAVILWDGGIGSAVLHCKNAHSGHVTALESLEDDGCLGDIFLTGGQDGVLQVWDFRARAPIHTASLHKSTKGTGALSCIAVCKGAACGCPLVVTAGADRTLKVLDPRSSFNIMHTILDHRDFVYSLFVSGLISWSGGGDGSLLVHDLITSKCLYGLGAISNGAVRCINLAGQQKEKLVITGDDGNVMVYSV